MNGCQLLFIREERNIVIKECFVPLRDSALQIFLGKSEMLVGVVRAELLPPRHSWADNTPAEKTQITAQVYDR